MLNRYQRRRDENAESTLTEHIDSLNKIATQISSKIKFNRNEIIPTAAIKISNLNKEISQKIFFIEINDKINDKKGSHFLTFCKEHRFFNPKKPEDAFFELPRPVSRLILEYIGGNKVLSEFDIETERGAAQSRALRSAQQ